MFTGIIEEMGIVSQVTPQGAGLCFAIEARRVTEELAIGDSIAVNGVCLTVVRKEGTIFYVEATTETLNKTTLGNLGPGEPLNLERSMRLGDRLGGHLVLGHVDGTATVRSRQVEGNGVRFTIDLPSPLRPYFIMKGSVAVDGISLTIADLGPTFFAVVIVPHTLAVTTIGQCRAGHRVNLEADLIGKYVASLLRHGPIPAAQALTEKRLKQWGF